MGNCFIILTSQPGYLDKIIKDKMGGAVQIEGFSKENIQECSELFLKSKEKSEAMIETGNENHRQQ